MSKKIGIRLLYLFIWANLSIILMPYLVFGSPIQSLNSNQHLVSIGLIQTGRRYAEVENLLTTLGYNVTLIPPTSGISTFQQYDIIYLPPGWASLGSGHKFEIEAKANDYKNYVHQGGGLLVECPSYYSSFTPKILPYSITINEKRNYYDWPPVIENPNHDITSQIKDFELPVPCNQITNLAIEYESLVKGKISQSPSLVVASYGSGKIIIQAGNPEFPFDYDNKLSYRVYRRMIGWLTNFIPKDADYGLTFFQTINTTEEVVSLDVNRDYLFVGMKKKISILKLQPKISEISSVSLSRTLKLLKVFGDYLLVADSSNVSLLNVLDPYHPKMTSSLYLESKTPESIFIYDEIGYIFASRPPFTNDNHIYCVSLANPDAITLIKTIRCNQIPSFPNQKSGLYYSNPYLYFASANSSGQNFEIYNMANLLAPKKVSEMDVDKQIPGAFLDDMNDISLKNKTGYILGQLGLVSINLADVFHPLVISHIPLSSYGIDLELSGNFAFITMAYYSTTSSPCNFGLAMIDISKPDSMKLKDYFTLPAYPREIVMKDSLLFIANGSAGISILNVNKQDVFPPKIDPGVISVKPVDPLGIAKLVGKTSSIYDMTPPVKIEVTNTSTNQTISKTVEDNGSFVVNINAATGDGLSLTANDNYNPKNTSAIIITPNVPLANIIPFTKLQLSGDARDIDVIGTTCCFALGENGLAFVDITNPHQPVVLSRMLLSGSVEDIKIIGKNVVAACDTGGVQVINFQNISSPILVTKQSVTGSAKGIDVQANYVIATISNITSSSASSGNINQSICIYEFTGQNLIKRGSLTYYTANWYGTKPTPYESAITVKGSYCFICDKAADFVIVNISDPNNPIKVKAIDLQANPRKNRLYINENRAYFLGADVDVFDITNPENPTKITEWKLPGSTQDLFISGNHAVMSETNGVGVLDITTISSPILIDYIGTPGTANKFFLRDSLMYLADGTAGLTILNTQTLAFDVNLSPNSFSLLFPLNGDTVYNLTPKLSWEDTGDPNQGDWVTYVLFYSNNSEFLNATSITNVQTNFCQLPKLEINRKYFWKVNAVDNHGDVRMSNQVFNFFTMPFKLISPANKTTVSSETIIFQWHSAFDPEPDNQLNYRLFYSLDSLFSDAIICDSCSDTTYTLESQLQDKTTYYWTVEAFDKHHVITRSSDVFSFWVNYNAVNDIDARIIPNDYVLDQNYPNPFNPQTTISYGLPKPANVVISIFDLQGHLVVKLLDSRKEAGYNVIVWNASGCASGTYFIKMQADNFVQVKKCVVLR